MDIKLAQRLKDAGYKTEACEWTKINGVMTETRWKNITADEIAEKLPPTIKIIDHLTYYLVIDKNNQGYNTGYETVNMDKYKNFFAQGKSLTEAIAELWIWARKEGVV